MGLRSMTEILAILQSPHEEFVKRKASKANGPADTPFLPWNAQRNILNKACGGFWTLEYPVLTKVDHVVFVQARINIQTTDGVVYFEGWGEKAQDFYPDGKPKPMYGDATKQAQRAAFKAACSMLGIGDWIRAKSQTFEQPKPTTNSQQPTTDNRQPKTQANLMPTTPVAAAKPAPLYADRKEMHAAAMAAQAPAAVAAKIETGLERACPANVAPDEWDARCAWVDRLLEITGRWPKKTERDWLSDQTKVEPWTNEELYHVSASELATIYEAAKENAVPREEALGEDEKFRKECVDAGFDNDYATRMLAKYTFRGQSEPNYDVARKQLAADVQRRARQAVSA
jgi:hypothetical protein